MQSTVQYIESNLHISYNQFIEILQKMPFELKRKVFIKAFENENKIEIPKKTRKNSSNSDKITKEQFLADFKQSLSEIKSMQTGKTKMRTLKETFNAE